MAVLYFLLTCNFRKLLLIYVLNERLSISQLPESDLLQNRYESEKSVLKNKSVFFLVLLKQFQLSVAGADLGFSRGGADLQKIFEKFVDLMFFRPTKLNFRALPKH